MLVISAHEADGGDEASREEEGSYVLQHRHLLQCLQKVTVSGKHGNGGREVERRCRVMGWEGWGWGLEVG